MVCKADRDKLTAIDDLTDTGVGVNNVSRLSAMNGVTLRGGCSDHKSPVLRIDVAIS